MGTTARQRRPLLLLLSAVFALLMPLFVSAGTVEACVHDINVTKQVVGERAPDASIEFTIHLVGAAGAFDETFQLVDGATVGFDAVPPGTYVISEESSGADAVTFLVDGVETDTLEVPAVGADQTWELVVVNDYIGARLSVEKQVIGNTPPPADTVFDFELRPVAPTVGTVVSFGLLAGEIWTSDVLPLGTYELVESNAPTGHTIVPNPIVLAERGATVEVIAENPFFNGFIQVTKTETGDTAPAATYSFDLTGPVDVSFELAAGDTWTSAALPFGTYTVTEVDGPVDHTIVPNPIVLDAEGTETVQVLVTNPYRDFHGRLAIEKVETGDTAPGGVYGFEIEGPVDLTALVAAGETWTSDWLPLGTYTVTEVGAPVGHTNAPNPVVLDTDGVTVSVTATNPYRDFHGRLAIEKTETGDAPGGVYTFEIDGPVDFTATVAAGETWTSDWLPLGTYTVTEVDAPDGHTIVPNPAVLETDGVTVLVKVTNPFGQVLPATGSGSMPVLLTSAGALVAAGVALLRVAGARRRDDLLLVRR